MKKLERYLHDVRTSLSGSLPRIGTEEARRLFSHTTLVAAGEVELNNSLEAEFYGQKEKTTLHRWPRGDLFHLRNVAVVGDQGHIFFDDDRCLAICRSMERMPDRKIRRPI